MDTLKPYISNPSDINDYISNFLWNTFINYQFLSVLLLVIVVVELVKRQFLIPKGISSRSYPWLTLMVSVLGALLVVELEFSRKFIFTFLMLVASSDLIYTLFGWKLVEWIIKIFTKKTGSPQETSKDTEAKEIKIN